MSRKTEDIIDEALLPGSSWEIVGKSGNAYAGVIQTISAKHVHILNTAGKDVIIMRAEIEALGEGTEQRQS